MGTSSGAARYTGRAVPRNDLNEPGAGDDAEPDDLAALLSAAGQELSAPITPLKMRLQLTRRRLQREGGRPRDVDDLAKALYHVERMQQQMALLLDATALLRDRFALAPRWHNLSGATRRLLAIYAGAGDSRAPRLVESVGELSGIWDGARLELAMRELLTNARRYSSGDVTLRLAREGCFAVVVVEDAGPGIPNDLRERIFDPYVTGSQPNHGLGLGLFVARAIARLHGGDLSLDASHSGGTAVRMTAPLPAR